MHVKWPTVSKASDKSLNTQNVYLLPKDKSIDQLIVLWDYGSFQNVCGSPR